MSSCFKKKQRIKKPQLKEKKKWKGQSHQAGGVAEKCTVCAPWRTYCAVFCETYSCKPPVLLLPRTRLLAPAHRLVSGNVAGISATTSENLQLWLITASLIKPSLERVHGVADQTLTCWFRLTTTRAVGWVFWVDVSGCRSNTASGVGDQFGWSSRSERRRISMHDGMLG